MVGLRPCRLDSATGPALARGQAFMSHEDIAAWEGFAVALAGAAAVLAGLVFVAVSMNIDRILPVRGLPGRAGESVLLFLTALTACAFVLVPHQPSTALGVELLVLGSTVLVVLILLVIPALRGPTSQPVIWHIARVVGITAATLPMALAGMSLVHWLPGGLYWLVAGVLCALAVSTANAWVLLVEVVRDQRYRPAEPS
jgi:modulator of FtsH protease